MEGEHDLAALLQNMYPEMHEGIFVFCTLADDAEIPATLTPLLTFREAEGTTLVIRQEQAERIGLPHHFGSRLITLTVHSSLEAVGFLAAIAAGLAKAGISVTTAAWSRQNDSATSFSGSLHALETLDGDEAVEILQLGFQRRAHVETALHLARLRPGFENHRDHVSCSTAPGLTMARGTDLRDRLNGVYSLGSIPRRAMPPTLRRRRFTHDRHRSATLNRTGTRRNTHPA